LTRGRIPHATIVKEGRVDEVILEEAHADQVIVLGASRMSEWKKFLVGSIPIKISQQGLSPVLIVK
jgi:nucleotide-binding universal stress UspA family protein